MGKGVYEYSFPNGTKVRWVLEKDGTVRYWEGDRWKFFVGQKDIRKLAEAMACEPLRHDEMPIVGEIIGYRCWSVYCGDLWALYRRHRWLPGATEQGHVGDEEGGIYAFKSLSRAVSEADDTEEWKVPIAVGSVALWGDAIEAADGWRAEYAKLVSLDYLFVPPPPAPREPTRWEKIMRRRSPPPQPVDRRGLLAILRRKYGVGRDETAPILEDAICD